MNEIICRVLRITGRVQGVGYRWSLCAEAEILGLDGWVRNRQDGSVEALIQGPAEAVEALTGWAQCGPPAAQVEAVVCNDQAGADCAPPSGFKQLPSC